MRDGLVERIAAFVRSIGIDVTFVPNGGGAGFLPGVDVREGRLLVDRTRLAWASDLLHEAGHIAVTDPGLRATLSTVPDNPAEEMAAIAWSYAAAVEIGLDARTLFHDGYKGGGASLAENFTAGRDVGVPMLELYGMTEGRQDLCGSKARPYPKMLRWLR